MSNSTNILNAAAQLQELGVPWFDDNPLGWEELAPPKGSNRSAWDLLTVTLTNPVAPAGFAAPTGVTIGGVLVSNSPSLPSTQVIEATWYAEVEGKLDLKMDIKQTPGKNDAKLTVINLNADEIHTVLYFLTPSDLLNFYNLIPNQVMSVTAKDLLAAAQDLVTGIGPQFRADIRNIPIVKLSYPSLALAGRRFFVLKTMGLVQPPRNGQPPMVHLNWVPQEEFNAVINAIKTANLTQSVIVQPSSNQTATSTSAPSPAADPTQNAP